MFVANAKKNEVHIIDVATNKIIQTADVGPWPEQIIFTLNAAYVRSRDSEIVLMIPLDQVGKGGLLSVADFTGGHTPFGLAATTSLADGMAPTPSGIAVVVANPVDKVVYYYREGMAAPMGEFSNHGRVPRAVMVVDRSLHETAPGEYTTHLQLTRNGRFDVAFLLDSPRVVHCFDLNVAERTDKPRAEQAVAISVEPIIRRADVKVGETVKLRYKVRDTRTGKPVTNLKDLSVLAFSSDNWQKRQRANHIKDGEYEASFVPANPGVYHVFCQVPSMGLPYRDVPRSLIRATNKPQERQD